MTGGISRVNITEKDKMDAQDQIYRDLQKHLNRPEGNFPAAESGADIRLLKHLLTPEGAKIATQLSTIKLEPVK